MSPFLAVTSPVEVNSKLSVPLFLSSISPVPVWVTFPATLNTPSLFSTLILPLSVFLISAPSAMVKLPLLLVMVVFALSFVTLADEANSIPLLPLLVISILPLSSLIWSETANLSPVFSTTISPSLASTFPAKFVPLSVAVLVIETLPLSSVTSLVAVKDKVSAVLVTVMLPSLANTFCEISTPLAPLLAISILPLVSVISPETANLSPLFSIDTLPSSVETSPLRVVPESVLLFLISTSPVVVEISPDTSRVLAALATVMAPVVAVTLPSIKVASEPSFIMSILPSLVVISLETVSFSPLFLTDTSPTVSVVISPSMVRLPALLFVTSTLPLCAVISPLI